MRSGGLNLRLSVTDQTGRVLLDSRGHDVGKDYARWLDVARTLRGEYGARTTRESADETSSVMYVAAPIVRDNAIAGVLSVGKPARSFQGFTDLTPAKAWESALWLFALALLLALGFSYWMTRDLRRLVEHANESQSRVAASCAASPRRSSIYARSWMARPTSRRSHSCWPMSSRARSPRSGGSLGSREPGGSRGTPGSPFS
jgi:two-component system sensor histidine kinase CreC